MKKIAILLILFVLVSCAKTTTEKPTTTPTQPIQQPTIEKIPTETQTDLAGKTIKELMQLQKPILCLNKGYETAAKKVRELNLSAEIPQKIGINGNNLREEGSTIWTDGRQTNSLNIFTNNKVYTVLPGTNMMTEIEDPDTINAVLETYYTINPKYLLCQENKIPEDAFKPVNLCYLPGTGKTPECKFES